MIARRPRVRQRRLDYLIFPPTLDPLGLERGKIMEWMLMPLRRYAEFGGRSRRMEYWMFALFSLLVNIASSIVDIFAFGYSFDDDGPMTILVNLALFIPSLAVGIRRLHDVGRSGWWMLLIFAIIIGWILLLVFFVTDGEHGDNEYGPDPKMDQNVGDVFS
jgi:uncharacterized membrane protein YhaH (DUF805 family)